MQVIQPNGVAALSDTEMTSFSTIARETGVSSPTIKGYFSILTDTLLGRWLPAYRKRVKRRVITSPKFYFSDVGVVNFLAKRHGLVHGSPSYGKAFENWVFHELNAYNAYGERFADLSSWRLPSGIEVDFIINQMDVAIEVKASSKIHVGSLKGLRKLKEEHPKLAKRIVVCMESKPRTTEDGIDILPPKTFANRLWAGAFF
jgi:predicted AAA+ superfamily ATPase